MEKDTEKVPEVQSKTSAQLESKPTPETKLEAKETKADNSALLKELAELKAFKAKIEQEQAQAKQVQDIPVKDTFLSTHETIAKPKQLTNTEKVMADIIEKGGFYRPN